MSAQDTTTPVSAAPLEHWTARFSRPIIFVIVLLIAIGAYVAISIPVAVFPEHGFPRIVVGTR